MANSSCVLALKHLLDVLDGHCNSMPAAVYVGYLRCKASCPTSVMQLQSASCFSPTTLRCSCELRKPLASGGSFRNNGGTTSSPDHHQLRQSRTSSTAVNNRGLQEPLSPGNLAPQVGHPKTGRPLHRKVVRTHHLLARPRVTSRPPAHPKNCRPRRGATAEPEGGLQRGSYSIPRIHSAHAHAVVRDHCCCLARLRTPADDPPYRRKKIDSRKRR